MPIKAVHKVRLSRRIAEHLSTLIASGHFEPGRPLPPERDLARELGVSRPSVREALISLEVEGKVEAKVGLGVFVSHPHSTRAGLSLPERNPIEVLRARRVVEGELAATAARLRTGQDLIAVRRALEIAFGALPGESWNDSFDRQFHLTVASAAHNDAMMQIIRDLCSTTHTREAAWTPALRAATMLDYRTIADAIEARDRRTARAAMHRHLDRRVLVATLGPGATFGTRQSLVDGFHLASF